MASYTSKLPEILSMVSRNGRENSIYEIPTIRNSRVNKTSFLKFVSICSKKVFIIKWCLLEKVGTHFRENHD